jgi:PAS domain S-box-containing protein
MKTNHRLPAKRIATGHRAPLKSHPRPVNRQPQTALQLQSAILHDLAKLEAAFQDQRQLLDACDFAEAILETVPPLLILDEKLCVLTASESFCKCFQIPSGKEVNVPVYQLGNGRWNIPKLRATLEKVLPRKGFFRDLEVTCESPDIGRRTVLVNGRQVDRLNRIMLFMEDITERRESQSAMWASEMRYRRLFEAARDGIFIVDPGTRKITDSNPFMTELLGYRQEELLGKELWEVGLLKDEKANRAAFRELQKSHYVRYDDLPLQNKTGQSREVEFVSNLYEEDGRSVIQCNIRDISQRKRAELSVLTAADKASRRAAQQEQALAECAGNDNGH